MCTKFNLKTDFLKTQEQRGHFFSKAMNKDSQNYNSNSNLEF